ncbi:hypothetical protein OG474_07345 [Kribbella sp. NBC_01505]|uniref:hypothetical protein n=1 Tax=Kribbella sp. NBC_01505 TaxID=2903580 RepID=UPI00386C3EFC
MTDDLHARMQRLVADPPPPTAVPSQAVFARVRKVRRRRAAGVAVLATAAVAAVVAISGNLSEIDSQPPVVGPPSGSTPSSTPTTPSPYGVKVTLEPYVTGRTVTMNISMSGTVLRPIADGGLEVPDNHLVALGQGTAYSWGDDSDIFSSFSNGSECVKAKTPFKGSGKPIAESHTYPRPGTYTYTYRTRFCGVKVDATASIPVVIN